MMATAITAVGILVFGVTMAVWAVRGLSKCARVERARRTVATFRV
jgi:hypothetical protein